MGTNVASPVIRSINNQHPSYVRFINSTSHEIEILWINYQGQAVSYGKIKAGNHLNIGTFATHPWIFVESQTMERFMANGKDVFYPQPWSSRPGDVRQRQTSPYLVHITIPLYELRVIAMKTIKLLLLDDNDAYQLDIPKNLQRELANAKPRKNRQ